MPNYVRLFDSEHQKYVMDMLDRRAKLTVEDALIRATALAAISMYWP